MLTKTKIEWTDYTLNPIKGLCQHNCWYCYARTIYKRFKLESQVILKPHLLTKIQEIKKPSKIFLCSTHDLFGNWIPEEWIRFILKEVKKYPQHTFQILTKNPQRLRSLNLQFPKNVWIGTSLTGNSTKDWQRLLALMLHAKAKVKFVSFEPLLYPIGPNILNNLNSMNWIIIGALTGPKKNQYKSQEKWIKDILITAAKDYIPVFMKNNLKTSWPGYLRQEFPHR